jgi:uncharacterized protein involved in copper resistance
VGKLENKPSHRDCPRARRAKPRQAQSARRETKDVELSDSTTIGAAQSAQHAENCDQVNSIGFKSDTLETTVEDQTRTRAVDQNDRWLH